MNLPQSEMIFLALARNCAPYLPAYFSFLERLSSDGITVASLVGENGSTDETLSILKSAEQKLPYLTYVDTSFIEQIAPSSRTRRLAEGRAALAKKAEALFPNAKYICVIDVDNVLEKMPSPTSFMASAGKVYERQDIFGVSAMSAPFYYDLAALRCRAIFNDNVIPLIKEKQQNPVGYYRFMQDRVYRVQHEFTSSKHRLCESAFNGLCIYKPSDYYQGSYVDESAIDVCEHVILNEGIHRSTGRKILVDDSLVLAMPQEHGPQSLPYFVGSRALKIARRSLQRLQG
jgi:glycosyltransferase involved in cell wall biosynthesis